jgi:hypothetical protein
MRNATGGAALLLAMTGCGSAPRVTFSAVPPFVCKGQTTTLSWETDASGATIVASPATVTVGTVAARDSRRIALSETTVFTITATKSDKSSTARQEVTVVDAAAAQRVHLDPKKCENGASIYETDVPPDMWPEIVHMGDVTLSSPLAFDLVVEHAGQTATVERGKLATAAFAGTPFSGHFRATLKTAKCDDALDAVVLPTNLSCAP